MTCPKLSPIYEGVAEVIGYKVAITPWSTGCKYDVVVGGM
jgi:hypothetical protein